MLKKISKRVIAILICLLFIPLVAKADMGAPETINYKVVVTDEDGITLYDWNFKKVATIPVDEVLGITMEENKDGELFGYTNYKNEYGYIRLSDVSLYKEEMTPDDIEDDSDYYHSNGKVYIFDEGVKLYKGPSKAYDLVMDDDIKVGTTLEYTYKNDTWLYTEYKGKKGWVYCYTYGFGDESKQPPVAEVKPGKFLTISEVTIYKDVFKSEETDVVIPEGEEVEYKYTYLPFVRVLALFVSYDGTEGWVFKETNMGESDKDLLVKFKTSFYLVNDKEYTVYSDLKCTKKVSTIKGNKIYKYIYQYYSYGSNDEKTIYYVEYSDGKYGWVSLKHDELATRNTAIYETLKELTVYKDVSKSSKTDKTIPEGKEVKVLYTYYSDGVSWYYVSDDDYEGWVFGDAKSLKLIDIFTLDDEDEEDPASTEVEDKKKKQKDDDEVSSDGISTIQIIIIAVAASLVVALTAIISIVLINRKKGKKA